MENFVTQNGIGDGGWPILLLPAHSPSSCCYLGFHGVMLLGVTGLTLGATMSVAVQWELAIS